MDIVYKVLITIFSVIILLSTGLSLTLSIADEIEINQYFTSVTETLVDSHYNEHVSQLLIHEAKENGYDLVIQLFGSTAPGAYKYAKVTLTYHFNINLFHISLPRMKEKII